MWYLLCEAPRDNGGAGGERGEGALRLYVYQHVSGPETTCRFFFQMHYNSDACVRPGVCGVTADGVGVRRRVELRRAGRLT